MGRIAKIISSKVDDNNNIICTVESKFGHNVQAPLYLPAGDDSFPLPDDRTILVEVEGTGNYIACGILNQSQATKKGEKVLFSRDANGDLVAKIYLQNDGKLNIETDDEINIIGSKKVIVNATEDIEIKSDANIKMQDGTDFAVRYNELKTQLDQLKSDLNTHLHNVVGVQAGGSTISSSVPTVLSSVDFTNCKIDNINIPAVGE